MCVFVFAQVGHRVDYSVDCLGFHDPGANTYHLGLADAVMHPMWNNYKNQISDILARVARSVLRCRADGTTTLNIQFYCKSGRHRASAAVSLAQGAGVEIRRGREFARARETWWDSLGDWNRPRDWNIGGAAHTHTHTHTLGVESQTPGGESPDPHAFLRPLCPLRLCTCLVCVRPWACVSCV